MRTICLIYTFLIICSIECHQHGSRKNSKGHIQLNSNSFSELHPQHDHLDHHHHHDYEKHEHGDPHIVHDDDKDQHHHHHHHSHGKSSSQPINFKTYVYSLTSTILISLAPIFLIFLLPNLSVDNSLETSPLLKILLSFASGGLLGDAFLHLIPHALLEYSEMEDKVNFEEIYNLVGLRVLMGILAFLLVDKIIRMLKLGSCESSHEHTHFTSQLTTHKNNDQEAFHNNGSKSSSKASSPFDLGHDLSNLDTVNLDVSTKNNTEQEFLDKTGDGLRQRRIKTKEKGKILDKLDGDSYPEVELLSLNDIDESVASAISTPSSLSCDEEIANAEAKEMRKIGLKTSAYLNLAADFAHNFTDGLAISASYMAGNSVGILATSTILLHEVPHEIGDYAILIQSGCSKKKAIILQFLTALGAISGTLIGLVSKQFFHQFISTLWILPFTAGGFIYVATVTILPELLNVSPKELEDSNPFKSLLQAFLEIGALLLGILLMIVLIYFE